MGSCSAALAASEIRPEEVVSQAAPESGESQAGQMEDHLEALDPVAAGETAFAAAGWDRVRVQAAGGTAQVAGGTGLQQEWSLVTRSALASQGGLLPKVLHG